MIVFSLFLIINSNLSTAFTVMPDGCLYYFPKDTFLEPFTQLMIFVLLFDYLLKTITHNEPSRQTSTLSKGKYVFIVAVLYTFMTLAYVVKGKIIFPVAIGV